MLTDQGPAERLPAIMGASEVAAEYRVQVSNLTKVQGLPEPVVYLACGPIWIAKDIKTHAAARRRARGR